MNSGVECSFCGLSFSEITWSHLKYSHGLTTAEYLKRFPGATLVSYSLRIDRGCSISESMRGKKLDPEHLEALRKGHKEFMEDPVRHAGWLENCRNSNGGRYERTEEWRRERSEITKKVFEDPEVRKRHAEGISLGNKGRAFSEEHKDTLSKSMKKVYEEGRGGWQNLTEDQINRKYKNSSKTHKGLWADPEYRDRMVRILAKARGKVPTEYEELLQLCLNKHFPEDWWYNGDGREDIYIGGRIPDFVRRDGKRCLIELFGCTYHHSLIPEDRGSEEETISHYAKCGYGCLVIWGDELFDEAYIARKVKELMERA